MRKRLFNYRNIFFVILGIIVVLVLFSSVGYLFFKYPPIKALEYQIDTLSDYGREDMHTKLFFNSVIFITGVLFTGFNWGFLKKIVGLRFLKIVGLVSSASISFVGIFNLPADYSEKYRVFFHWAFAIIFLFGFPSVMSLVGYFMYKKTKDTRFFIMCLICLLSILGQMIIFFTREKFAVMTLEIYGAIMLTIWLFNSIFIMLKSKSINEIDNKQLKTN